MAMEFHAEEEALSDLNRVGYYEALRCDLNKALTAMREALQNEGREQSAQLVQQAADTMNDLLKSTHYPILADATKFIMQHSLGNGLPFLIVRMAGLSESLKALEEEADRKYPRDKSYSSPSTRNYITQKRSEYLGRQVALLADAATEDLEPTPYIFRPEPYLRTHRQARGHLGRIIDQMKKESTHEGWER